jgi:hypothetical protein
VSVRACYFIVHDDGTFWRLAKKRFFRILQPRDGDTHPEFKAQRIKYAEINVDFDGRRPLAVQSAYFGHLKFDENGCLDEAEQERFEQLMIQTWPSPTGILQPRVAHLHTARARQQIEREFSWQPEPALRDQLYDAALHNRLVGGYRH